MTLNEHLVAAAQMERDGFSKKETDDYLWEVQLRDDEEKANADTDHVQLQD